MPINQHHSDRKAAAPTDLSAPDTKAGRLQRACLDLLHEHKRKGEIPINGRFLFYELEQRGVIPKNYDGVNPKTGQKWARTPLQDVSNATMHLRDHGLTPWPWIEDETRTLTKWRYAASVAVQEVHDPLDGLAKGPAPKLLNGGQS